MDRKRLLLIAAAGIAVVLLPCASQPAAAEPSECSRVEYLSGDCPQLQAQIIGGGVVVSVARDIPGGSRSGSDGAGAGMRKLGKSTPPASGAGRAWSGDFAPRDTWTVTSPVTLADLVNFAPTPGVDHMQPNGWMIVGLDTNFYAAVGPQVKSGVLLGRQAQVRFTPTRYHWAYGDGYQASLASKGAPWASQGGHEFDHTPTSHVYTRAGTYSIDLGIDFTAEYRYAGGDWVPIAGTLPVVANRLTATAGSAKTVLVHRDCTVPPHGPGC